MSPDDFEAMAGAYVEPSADVRAACAGIRQVYLGLLEQGFDDRQSLVVIGQIIAAGGKA